MKPTWWLCVAMIGATIVAGACGAAPIAFNDPLAANQWYLNHMNFGEAWSQVRDLRRRGVVKAAVIDSGFDRRHEDLNGRLLRGINIVEFSQRLGPVHPHGTGTIGPLAARQGNGKGISNAAWVPRVMPIRITNRRDGLAYVSDMARAIRFAANRGVRVINISYSGVHLRAIGRAARYAAKQGAVVFMAAGNDGWYHPGWRNFKWVVAVGSVDSSGDLSYFSSRGDFVDFVAPGEDFKSLLPYDRYADWDGTSFASPIAASVATLMLAANPRLSPGQILAILRRSAIDLDTPGHDPNTGHGLIDAAEAVRQAIEVKGIWRKARGKRLRRIRNSWKNIRGLIESDEQSLGGTLALSPVLPVNGSFRVIPEPGSAAVALTATLLILPRRPRRRP